MENLLGIMVQKCAVVLAKVGLPRELFLVLAIGPTRDSFECGGSETLFGIFGRLKEARAFAQENTVGVVVLHPGNGGNTWVVGVKGEGAPDELSSRPGYLVIEKTRREDFLARLHFALR